MPLDDAPRPADPPPFSGTIALLTIARVQDAALAEALKPLGLSTRKYGLLGHVRGTPGISFSELARRSRVTVQSAHTAVAALAEAGLVEDATAQAGAASSLRVTAAGSALLDEAARRLEALDAALAEQHPELVAALREGMLRALRS